METWKEQKVKHDGCDLCPLAQEIVLYFCQGNLESYRSRFSRYRLSKTDGIHQHLSGSYRPCHIGQAIVMFQLDSSNVLFLRKIQRIPRQSKLKTVNFLIFSFLSCFPCVYLRVVFSLRKVFSQLITYLYLDTSSFSVYYTTKSMISHVFCI